MNNRGQLYILAALILAVVVFWTLTASNTFIKEDTHPSFEDLSRNYDIESRKLVNDLLEGGVGIGAISQNLITMSDNFVYSYAKRQDPAFGVVFILTKGDSAEIVNFLDTGITTSGGIIASPDDSCVVGQIKLSGININTDLDYTGCGELFDEDTLQALRGSAGIDYKLTSANIANLQGGDTLVIDIAGIMYEFEIGENIQLNSIARRQEDGQVQVFKTQ